MTGERGPFNQPIYKHTDLRELMTFGGQINFKRFGRLLANSRDKICDGWQICVSDTKAPAKIYHLVQVRAASAPQPVTAVAGTQKEPF